MFRSASELHATWVLLILERCMSHRRNPLFGGRKRVTAVARVPSERNDPQTLLKTTWTRQETSAFLGLNPIWNLVLGSPDQPKNMVRSIKD